VHTEKSRLLGFRHRAQIAVMQSYALLSHFALCARDRHLHRWPTSTLQRLLPHLYGHGHTPVGADIASEPFVDLLPKATLLRMQNARVIWRQFVRSVLESWPPALEVIAADSFLPC